MYVQPLDGSLTPNSLAAPTGSLEGEGALLQGAALPSGDNISRFLPPWLNDNAASSAYGDVYGSSGSMQGLFGSLMGVLQQLTQMLQSLMGYGGNQRYFQNATGSSDGDPHLSFNGQKWFLVAWFDTGFRKRQGKTTGPWPSKMPRASPSAVIC